MDWEPGQQTDLSSGRGVKSTATTWLEDNVDHIEFRVMIRGPVLDAASGQRTDVFSERFDIKMPRFGGRVS